MDDAAGQWTGQVAALAQGGQGVDDDVSVASAGEIYGSDSREQKATREAWSEVGI